jgi:uncharacterized protein (TIGR02145 family)
MKAILFLLLVLMFIIMGCEKDESKDESSVTLPRIITTAISNITTSSGTSGGDVISDGGSPVTSRGVCWCTDPDPTTDDSKTTDGNGTGVFQSAITGLVENTTYYVRAYATNSEGTSYGEQYIFTTTTEPVMDIEANVYNTVGIGDQIWMKENLKVTRLNDNTPIPHVPDNIEWYSLSTPGYCYFNNDEMTSKDVYGTLYNGYTISTDKLCPSGWHVPTDAEWTTLASFLGGESDAGGKLKEAGFTHWSTPNTGATNEVLFSALPGGWRTSTSLFYDQNYSCRLWSSTESSISNYWYREMYFDNAALIRGEASMLVGHAVRCLKN